eukprot:UN23505
MPAPVLILIVLMIRCVALEGADDGIEQYLGKWDMDDLNDSEVWSVATGQVFFTLSVTMGIMTAYSSFIPENQNIVVDEKYISIGDYSIAFIAGFTIYAILGNTVYECKRSTDAEKCNYGLCDSDGNISGECDDLYDQSSLGLTFQLVPYGLSTLPAPNFWCCIFFLMLFMLGIDSAFSMVEAATTVIGDSQVAQRLQWSKESVTLNISLMFSLSELFIPLIQDSTGLIL